MKPFRIKIVQCSGPFWYAPLVGKTVEVTDFDESDYQLAEFDYVTGEYRTTPDRLDGNGYILKADCERYVVSLDTVKVSCGSDLFKSVNYDMGKKYYLGYVSDIRKENSVYFPDLEWLKGVFGERLENLNEGRQNEIDNLKKCLKYNIPMRELNYLQDDGTFRKQYEKQKYGQDKEYEYKPDRLSEDGRKQFQANIDLGLLVLCELTKEEINEPQSAS